MIIRVRNFKGSNYFELNPKGILVLREGIIHWGFSIRERERTFS